MKTFSHKELLLDAVTTGGAEKTAARAGSPPLYTEKDGHFFPVGTINIMISLNISLPSAIMTRAIITITEGKTAALQDLGIADCLELYDKPWNRDDSLATPPAVDLSRLRNKECGH